MDQICLKPTLSYIGTCIYYVMGITSLYVLTYKNFIHWSMFRKAHRSNSITLGNFLTTYAGEVRKCHKIVLKASSVNLVSNLKMLRQVLFY